MCFSINSKLPLLLGFPNFGENENLSDLNFQCLLLLSHMSLSIDVNPETSHILTVNFKVNGQEENMSKLEGKWNRESFKLDPLSFETFHFSKNERDFLVKEQIPTKNLVLWS